MNKEYLLTGGVGIITTVIGGWHLTLQVLIILMAVDIMTGCLKGWKQSNFSSRAFRDGLVGKAGFFLVIILAFQLDVLMGNVEPVIRICTTTIYIAIEGISILENLGEMGVYVPNFIKQRLAKLKDSMEDKGAEQDSQE